MKLSVLLITLYGCLCCDAVCAQITSKKTSKFEDKFNISLDAGLKIIPIDWLKGFAAGISIQHKTKPFGVSIRKDAIFSIGRGVIPNTGGVGVNYERFILTDYGSFSYFTVDYRFTKRQTSALSLGYGSIYSGATQRPALFSRESNYGVITLAYRQKISWLNAEIRADIPYRYMVYDRGDLRSFYGADYLFPVSFALFYRFSK